MARRSTLQSLLQVLLRAPLWALPFAVFFGTLFGGARWSGYVAAYRISLVFAVVINLSIWAMERFLLRRVMDRVGPGRGWLHVLFYGGASVVGSYLAATIVHFTLLPGFMGSARAVAINGMFALLFTTLIGGIYTAIHFHRAAMERGREIERAHTALAEAELRALRAQIHPHFLFNTLNTIASLVREHPEAAEETTTRLAEVFRHALQGSDRPAVRLSEELEFLRSYLAIERTRFGERLRVRESIEPGLEGVAIPSLLLQPLVENAIRHGLSSRPEGGALTISARRDGALVHLEVADDGPGFDPQGAPAGTGFGLRSVRERLALAGPPHALAVDTAPGRGTRVRVTLPFQPMDTPSNERRPS